MAAEIVCMVSVDLLLDTGMPYLCQRRGFLYVGKDSLPTSVVTTTLGLPKPAFLLDQLTIVFSCY